MANTPLIPLDRLKARVGIVIAETVWDEPLTEALLIGETRAADFLGSTLRPVTDVKDTFDIYLSNFFGRMGKEGYYTLVLRNRFIHANPVITISTSEGMLDISDACILNLELGVVKIPTEKVERYANVVYSAGLSDTIPAWVEETILCYAQDVFALPDEQKRNAGRGAKEGLADLYASHHKQVPFAIRPM